MKIPKYWAKALAKVKNPAGEEFLTGIWRWSEASQADAEQKAKEAAERISQRHASSEELSRYAYGEQPLREEIVRILGDAGSPLAVITRNSQGCLVLNAGNAMFVDIDLPPGNEPSVLGFVSKFFGKSPKPSPEATALAVAKDYLDGKPGWGARVYRTAGGLRLLFTHAPFDPKAGGTFEIMTALKADPLYMKLCRSQECFRARLTPKPWRIGLGRPSCRYPYPTESALSEIQNWAGEYEEECAGFATCKLVEVLGKDKPHESVAPIVLLHDKLTRIEEELPLA